MNPLAHFLAAFAVSWTLASKARDRALIVLAGVLPDIDGAPILFDKALYAQVHHTIGHSYVFGLPLALAAGALACDRRRTAALALAAFTLHLAADIVGTNWPVQALYPLSDHGLSVAGILSDETIYGAINPAAFAVAAAAAVAAVLARSIMPGKPGRAVGGS